MLLLNLLLNPFFMIEPYVLLAQNYQMCSRVLASMLMWSWLVQLIYGISYGIETLKIEGTIGIILMAPINFITYQLYYFIYLFLFNIVVTSVVLLLTWLFLGITVSQLPSFILTLIISSLGLFCFTVGYSSLILKYKKMNGINTFMQNAFGFLSGYTVSVSKFPTLLRFLSFLLPLTYSIYVVDQNYVLKPIVLFSYVLVCLMWLGIGIYFVNHNLVRMKRKGDFEQW